MTVPSMAAVEPLRVHAVQVAHPAREVGVEGAHEQVVVVAQQAVAEAVPVATFHRLGEDLEEAFPIGRVSIDRSALVAPCGEVVDAEPRS